MIGPCNWNIIKKIKETVSIPVFANGGIRTLEDVQKCLEYTGVDGVMTSEAILENPAFFSPEWHHIEQVMSEYIDFAEKYEENINTTRSHLYKSLYSGLKVHTDLRDSLTVAKTFDEMRAVVTELAELRKDESPESKIQWYHRYWKEHEKELAYTDVEYDEFISIMDDKRDNSKKKQGIEDEGVLAVNSLFTQEDEY